MSSVFHPRLGQIRILMPTRPDDEPERPLTIAEMFRFDPQPIPEPVVEPPAPYVPPRQLYRLRRFGRDPLEFLPSLQDLPPYLPRPSFGPGGTVWLTWEKRF